MVRFRECFAAGPYLCIAMELVPGGDLLELVNATRGLPENEARYLFQQLVGGVAAPGRRAGWRCLALAAAAGQAQPGHRETCLPGKWVMYTPPPPGQHTRPFFYAHS